SGPASPRKERSGSGPPSRTPRSPRGLVRHGALREDHAPEFRPASFRRKPPSSRGIGAERACRPNRAAARGLSAAQRAPPESAPGAARSWTEEAKSNRGLVEREG